MSLFDNTNQEHKGGLRQVFEAAKPALNLTADQEQKIKEIFKNFREERHDIKDSGADNMRDDMRNARQETRHQVMNVLNDEQKKNLQKHLSEWKKS